MPADGCQIIHVSSCVQHPPTRAAQRAAIADDRMRPGFYCLMQMPSMARGRQGSRPAIRVFGPFDSACQARLIATSAKALGLAGPSGPCLQEGDGAATRERTRRSAARHDGGRGYAEVFARNRIGATV